MHYQQDVESCLFTFYDFVITHDAPRNDSSQIMVVLNQAYAEHPSHSQMPRSQQPHLKGPADLSCGIGISACICMPQEPEITKAHMQTGAGVGLCAIPLKECEPKNQFRNLTFKKFM